MAFKLPRLPTNWKEQPQLFERYWDDVMSQLEKVLNSLLDIPLIQEALADLSTATANAQSAADAANAAASDAQTATDEAKAEASIVSSYVTGFVGSILVADNLGNVTVAAHTRTYGDTVLNPSRSVAGAVVATAAASGSVVRIYYNDASRLGGTVSYLFTVDPAAPPVQGGIKHSVGAVTIPAAGTNNGREVTPPGYVEP